MYVKLSRENDSADLADFFFVFVIMRTKFV